MLDKEAFKASGILEQFVLGLTSEEESLEVQRYLHAFPDLLEEVKGMQKALEKYATSQSIPPPKHLKSNILQEIEKLEQASSQPLEVSSNKRSIYSLSFWSPLVLALALVSVVFAIFFYNQQKNTQREFDQLSLQYNQLNVDYVAAQNRCAERERVLAFLQNEKTKAVYLEGTKLSPNASALVYYNQEDQNVYLNLQYLPTPPEGKQYQIWADVEGVMVNMGLIDSQVAQLQALIFIPEAGSFNITLEPIGGSEHPTVELLYVNGKVG